MDRKGPLAETYWAAVAMVLLALTPFLVLSSASFSLAQIVGKGTGLSEGSLELTNGLANAAYCFGTVLAVQLVQHLPPRRLLILFASIFVVVSAAAAWAPVPGVFAAARVLQGLTTSLMLITAVPPLVTGWPKRRLRTTAVVMNLAIFGAVALGPVIGGISADAASWRPLYWTVAAFGLGALVLALLTYEDDPPQDHSAPVDVISIALAASGCAAAFFGASELIDHKMLDPVVILPLAGGLALIGALIAHQYTVEDPLMPIRKLAHTFPLAAIVAAMAAAAASTGLVTLAQSALQLRGVSPAHGGVLFLPELAGAVLTAVVFGAIFFTRFIPVLAFTGLLILGGGGVVLTGVATGSDILVLVGSGAVGIGVGASVAPSLFVTGFSLPSDQLPRVFALIELLRGVAAFLAVPLLIHLAETTGASPADGIETAVWVCVGIALFGAAFAAVIATLGGARLQQPDVDTWLEGEEPALQSPRIGDRVRGAAERPSAAGG